MNKKTVFKWRVNYVVSYQKPAYTLRFRGLFLHTLRNVALLNQIDCAIKVDHPLHLEEHFQKYNDDRGLSADLVYFRAEPQTALSAREFRRLIDAIFREYSMLTPVEVFSQDYKALKNYPFPKETDVLKPMILNVIP